MVVGDAHRHHRHRHALAGGQHGQAGEALVQPQGNLFSHDAPLRKNH